MTHHGTHSTNLDRVRRKLADVIVSYLRGIGVGGTFHATDLHEHCQREGWTAPASADRVLRDLRQRGAIGYTLESRSRSLYRVTSTEPSEVTVGAQGWLKWND